MGSGTKWEERYELGLRVGLKLTDRYYRLEFRPPQGLTRELDVQVIKMDVTEGEALDWLERHTK